MNFRHFDNLSSKKITVFGLSKSGSAVAKLLDRLGAEVLITDSRTAPQLRSELEILRSHNFEFILGGHSNDCINSRELIVVSPGVPLDIPTLTYAKSIGIPIVGELEIASTFCKAPIIAITGTKGKTTTTLITAHLLENGNFDRVCVAGNIGNPLSNDVLTLTENDVVVAEVSSFQLETTLNFRPKIAVMLNFGRDHLDRHHTMTNYRLAKEKIYANQVSQDFMVVNKNDLVALDFAEKSKARSIYFSIDDKRSREIYNISEIPLKGSHNLQNALAAISVAELMNIDPDKIRSALTSFSCEKYSALEYAFQFVREIDGVRYINDSKATNIMATKAALESLDRPVILLMGGYDKGNDYEPLKHLICSKVKKLILIGDVPMRLRNAFSDFVVTSFAESVSFAVELAHRESQNGDIVLFSPAHASFDMFANYKERGKTFREAVQKLG